MRGLALAASVAGVIAAAWMPEVGRDQSKVCAHAAANHKGI